MRLQISNINGATINFLENKYAKLTTTPLIADQLKKKLEHNQAMLDISLALSYAELDDLK